MAEISRGQHPLVGELFTVQEVADRYEVHRDTAYKAIRAGHVLYPEAIEDGVGPRPRLLVWRQAVEACDERRLTYYRTTAAWHGMSGNGIKPPPRRVSGKRAIEAAGKRGA